MGKIRGFLTFFVFAIMMLNVGNAFAAGYVCDTKEYLSCKADHYRNAVGAGNNCDSLCSETKSNETRSCTPECTVANGTCEYKENSGTQACTGNYESGPDNNTVIGPGKCFGCKDDAWDACTGGDDFELTSCNAGYFNVTESGESNNACTQCPSETVQTAATEESIDGGTRYAKTTRTSTGLAKDGVGDGVGTAAERCEVTETTEYECECNDGYTETNRGTAACACVSNTTTISCEKGYFLPRGESECRICNSITYCEENDCDDNDAEIYCPGGDFEVNDEITQGVEFCPKGYESTLGARYDTDCYVTVMSGKYKKAVSDDGNIEYGECKEWTYSGGTFVNMIHFSYYGETETEDCATNRSDNCQWVSFYDDHYGACLTDWPHGACPDPEDGWEKEKRTGLARITDCKEIKEIMPEGCSDGFIWQYADENRSWDNPDGRVVHLWAQEGYYTDEKAETCPSCKTVPNTESTETQLHIGDAFVGTRTQTCIGNYETSRGSSAGIEQCTGCDKYEYSCDCQDGYHSVGGDGTACTCESDIIACEPGKYFDGNQMQDCTGGEWYCPGEGTAKWQQQGCRNPCPEGYTCENGKITGCPDHYEWDMEKKDCVPEKKTVYFSCQTYVNDPASGRLKPGEQLPPPLVIEYGQTLRAENIPDIKKYCLPPNDYWDYNNAGWCQQKTAIMSIAGGIDNFCLAKDTVFTDDESNPWGLVQNCENGGICTVAPSWTRKPQQCPAGQYWNYTKTPADNPNDPKGGLSPCPAGSYCATKSNATFWWDADECESKCSDLMDKNHPESEQGSSSRTDCYRQCTAADVPNAAAGATISGRVHFDGDQSDNNYDNQANVAACMTDACDDDSCRTDSGRCVKKPENTQSCGGGRPDCPITCKPGRKLHDTDCACVDATYTVTYDCGDGGTGPAPKKTTATYNAEFTPAENTCTRENYDFAGWMVSDTEDVKAENVGFTWTYTEDKTLTAQWSQGFQTCETGSWFNNGVKETCPEGYYCNGKDNGRDQIAAGTSGCRTKCEPGIKCPAGSEKPGDPCEPGTYCPSGKDCPESHPNSDAGAVGINACYRECGIANATEYAGDGRVHYDDQRGEPPYDNAIEAAMCTVTQCASGYYVANDGTKCKECPENAETCGGPDDPGDFTCKSGYKKNAAGDDCVKIEYEITLDDTPGSGGDGSVTAYYGAPMPKLDKLPTNGNFTFGGYFAQSEGKGTQYYDAKGESVRNWDQVEEKRYTLYARWIDEEYVCVAGVYGDANTSCTPGYFCAGGTSVSASTKDDCRQKCPTDNVHSGATVSSQSGSDKNTQCYSTFDTSEGVHGKAKMVCYYSDTSLKYDNRCTISVYECDAGYYRAKEDATVCSQVGTGNYSPAPDLDRYECAKLNNDNDNGVIGGIVTTEQATSGAATMCYNTCPDKPITNGVQKAKSDKVYYNGTKIPACEYYSIDNKPICNDGYQADGANCVSKCIKITLDHNGATAAENSAESLTNAIYLKYNEGWYSNASCTISIESVVKPWKAETAFAGYVYSGQTIINADARIIGNTMFTDTPVTITASWGGLETKTCAEGEYMPKGQTECKKCDEGDGDDYYCPGGPYTPNPGDDAGRFKCPDGNYTAANGATVVIHAEPNASKREQCYAVNVRYDAPSTQGNGYQTCYYKNGTYNDRCYEKHITYCNGGYYVPDPAAAAPDCTAAGKGHYSPVGDTERKDCPELDTDAEIDTDSETSAAITACSKGGLQYQPENGHSKQIRRCHWNASNSGYNDNCARGTIVACDAGYYKSATNTDDCVPVGDGFWSPGESGFPTMVEHESNPSPSLNQNPCPSGGKTGTTTAGAETQCYLTCPTKAVTNGKTASPQASKVSYDTTTQSYPACKYMADCNAGYKSTNPDTYVETPTCEECAEGEVCPGGTGTPSQCPSEYPNADAGAQSDADCWRACQVSDVANAKTVNADGRVYNDAKHTNTCKATYCEPGYKLNTAAGTCTQCAAGKVCDGGANDEDCPENHYCPSDGGEFECPASHPKSNRGAKTKQECYKVCDPIEAGYQDVENGRAVPVSDKVFFDAKCEFRGESENGNPCDLVSLGGGKYICTETACKNDMELVGGRCVPCNREHALGYKPLPAANCTVSACEYGWQPLADRCVATEEECFPAHATRAVRKWDSKAGTYGLCVIQECEYGYHVENNTCVTDVRACNVANGVGEQEWNQATKQWGACVATSCKPGYTSDRYQAIANEVDIAMAGGCANCANKYGEDGELAVSTYTRECEIASCMYQGERYNLDGDECVRICYESEDETGTMHWNASRKKCERTCKDGYASW